MATSEASRMKRQRLERDLDPEGLRIATFLSRLFKPVNQYQPPTRKANFSPRCTCGPRRTKRIIFWLVGVLRTEWTKNFLRTVTFRRHPSQLAPAVANSDSGVAGDRIEWVV